MDIITPTNTLPASAVSDDPFFELVHGDPLLLRAEFDDLIAASWDDAPPSHEPPTSAIDGGDSRSNGIHRDNDRAAKAQDPLRTPAARTGQRSPP